MERRKFMIGAGSTAIGASAIVGSGAFSLVASERTASVRVAEDPEAYLGLDQIDDSPNSSYVDFDDKHHLRIRMDDDNPTEDDSGSELGYGVNSNSLTVFNDLFQICNNGKQTVKVFIFKIGPWAKRVGFFTSGGGPCWDTTLDVGECIDVGMLTFTQGIEADTQLLNDVVIVAVGTEEGNPDDYEEEASEHAPEDADPNDELPSDD